MRSSSCCCRQRARQRLAFPHRHELGIAAYLAHTPCRCLSHALDSTVPSSGHQQLTCSTPTTSTLPPYAATAPRSMLRCMSTLSAVARLSSWPPTCGEAHSRHGGAAQCCACTMPLIPPAHITLHHRGQQSPSLLTTLRPTAPHLQHLHQLLAKGRLQAALDAHLHGGARGRARAARALHATGSPSITVAVKCRGRRPCCTACGHSS